MAKRSRDLVETCCVCASKVPAKRRGKGTCSVACERRQLDAQTQQHELQWAAAADWRSVPGRAAQLQLDHAGLRLVVCKVKVQGSWGYDWTWHVREGATIHAAGREHGQAMLRAQARALDAAADVLRAKGAAASPCG